VPDAIFAEPRLAEIYDPLDPDRSDLDVYAGPVRTWTDLTGVEFVFIARRGVRLKY
jgi:hypothetical protein